jgi:hypothetical protein
VKRDLVAIISMTFLLASCAVTPKNSVPEAGWMNNMHRLSAAHLYLLPKVANGAKFSDPALRKGISANLKAMAEAATALAQDPRAPDADPLISATTDSFAREARQAYAAFQGNDPQLARFTMSRASRYCISCHTRTDRGVRDFPVGWTSELAGLKSVEKIDFYLANRHYQSAWAEANKLAREKPSVSRDSKAWLTSIKRTMAMVVRVNDDPEQAEELAYLTFSNKQAPHYLRREAMGWVGDIREWRVDKKRKSKREPFLTAKNLMDVRPSFIRSLRASSILHEVLEDTNSKRYPEALLYAGLAAIELTDFGTAHLDQYYFESCIKRSPQSELAEKCYGLLEKSVLRSNPLLALDPDLAMAEEARLVEWRNLAEVRDNLNDPRFFRREEKIEPPNHGP